MLLCPKCKSEYQEGYKICSDCQCELIEIPDEIKKNKPDKTGALTLFISGVLILLGLLMILLSPMLSYAFTESYFSRIMFYDPEQFRWMLHAFHYSIMLVGSIICLPCIIYCIKYRTVINTFHIQ